jgi:hypothetical protein
MIKRTDLQIIADGDFAKIGKKHFRHVSGAEIQYDCMAWGWRACGWLWKTLEVAVYNVRTEAKGRVSL